MTEEDVRRIVRDELEKVGGLDIGEAIALQVRTTLAAGLRQIGAEDFMRAWGAAHPRGEG